MLGCTVCGDKPTQRIERQNVLECQPENETHGGVRTKGTPEATGRRVN